MSMGITALTVNLPQTSVQYSRLGTVYPATYRTLRDQAGKLSRPPLWFGDDGTDGYRVATAPRDAQAPDMTSAAIADLLTESSVDTENVHTIMHCQATLNEQLLASSCLRIQHEYFNHASLSLTLGQMGTAGFMTGLKLAQLQLKQQTNQHGMVALSASDKWVSPFPRRFGGVVAYDDAAGGCLLQSTATEGEYIAEVLAVAATHGGLSIDFWQASDEQRAEQLVANAAAAVREVISDSDYQLSDLDDVYGEPYGMDIPARVLNELQVENLQKITSMPISHESSVAPLAALNRACKQADECQRCTLNVIWSASLSGHAGAMLVRCHPSARKHNASSEADR